MSLSPGDGILTFRSSQAAVCPLSAVDVERPSVLYRRDQGGGDSYLPSA